MRVFCLTLVLFHVLSLFGQKDSKQEEIIRLTATKGAGKIYFNLSIKNERQSDTYSLIRKYPDGSVESVALKDAYPNELDQPILYSFVDRNVPEKDLDYELIKIGVRDSRKLAVWHYQASNKELVMDKSYSY